MVFLRSNLLVLHQHIPTLPIRNESRSPEISLIKAVRSKMLISRFKFSKHPINISLWLHLYACFTQSDCLIARFWLTHDKNAPISCSFWINRPVCAKYTMAIVFSRLWTVGGGDGQYIIVGSGPKTNSPVVCKSPRIRRWPWIARQMETRQNYIFSCSLWQQTLTAHYLFAFTRTKSDTIKINKC